MMHRVSLSHLVFLSFVLLCVLLSDNQHQHRCRGKRGGGGCRAGGVWAEEVQVQVQQDAMFSSAPYTSSSPSSKVMSKDGGDAYKASRSTNFNCRKEKCSFNVSLGKNFQVYNLGWSPELLQRNEALELLKRSKHNLLKSVTDNKYFENRFWVQLPYITIVKPSTTRNHGTKSTVVQIDMMNIPKNAIIEKSLSLFIWFRLDSYINSNDDDDNSNNNRSSNSYTDYDDRGFNLLLSLTDFKIANETKFIHKEKNGNQFSVLISMGRSPYRAGFFNIVVEIAVRIEKSLHLRAVCELSPLDLKGQGLVPRASYKYLWDEVHLNYSDEFPYASYTYLDEGIERTQTEQTYVKLIETAFRLSLQNMSKLTNDELENFVGFSGYTFRHFLNNLASYEDTVYLEIGTYLGSTLVSVLKGNRPKAVLAIDDWSGVRGVPVAESLGSKGDALYEKFEHNLSPYKNCSENLNVLRRNCWDVSPSEVKSKLGNRLANVYFFDGPHLLEDHFMSLSSFYNSLDQEFIFIVDDWAEVTVRQGTFAAISALKLLQIVRLEVFTDINPELEASMLHNGFAVFVLRKT